MPRFFRPDLTSTRLIHVAYMAARSRRIGPSAARSPSIRYSTSIAQWSQIGAARDVRPQRAEVATGEERTVGGERETGVEARADRPVLARREEVHRDGRAGRHGGEGGVQRAGRGRVVEARDERDAAVAHEREGAILDEQELRTGVLERDGEVDAVAGAADRAADRVGDRDAVGARVADVVAGRQSGAVGDAGGGDARSEVEAEARVAPHRGRALARQDQAPAG